MQKVHLEAAEDHVERLAHERDPVGAIKELIWNSLDADATKVTVSFEQSEMEGIEKVILAYLEYAHPGLTPEEIHQQVGKKSGDQSNP